MIRICVPSLDDPVRAIKDGILVFEHVDILAIQQYITSDNVGYMSAFSEHRYMYNFRALSELLRAAGFMVIEERSFRAGSISDVSRLDTRAGLFVEAKKA